MNSISNLPKEEAVRLSKKWKSIYPFLYHEMINLDKKQFKFYNEEMATLFNSLKSSNDLKASVSHVESFLKKNELKKVEVNFLSEFFNTFYPLNKISIKWFLDTRLKILEEKYKDNTIENILWRHDGWFNCYYGEIEDKESVKVLEKEFLKDNNTLRNIKMALTLSYRYLEVNKKKNAIKLIKSIKKFLRLKLFFFIYKDDIKTDDSYEISEKVRFYKPLKILYSMVMSKTVFNRYNLNLLMLLYRIEENKKKKLKIINKILRDNQFHKAYLQDEVLKFFSFEFPHVKLYMRPQHILKLIEIKVDKYCLKKEQRTIDEIMYLFRSLFFAISKNYYKREESPLLVYFVMTETYFIIYYFLKNIYPELLD